MNLIDIIDQSLLSEERREKTSHYPSEINDCMRKLYYKWTGEGESNPIMASGLFKMRVGNFIHNLLQEELEKIGFDVIHEVGEKKDIGLLSPISYRVDSLFVNPENKKTELIEIKSGYGNGIRQIKRSGPKESDINQSILYMYLLDIERCYLIYYARDDGYRLEYHIERIDNEYYCDKKFLNIYPQDLIKKFEAIEKYLDIKKLPDRDFKAAIKNGEIRDKFQKDNIVYKTYWQCGYCAYKDTCWKDEVLKYLDSDNSGDFDDLSTL